MDVALQDRVVLGRPHVLFESTRETLEKVRVAAQQAVTRAGEDVEKRTKAEAALKDVPDYVTAMKNVRFPQSQKPKTKVGFPIVLQ